MARDSLRAALDELRADPAAADRTYLEAMLRRLGYTEREIREELGPVAEATPAAPAPDLPPTREYRLVLPAKESTFWVGDGSPAPRNDAPFEALERVEFEEVAGDDQPVEAATWTDAPLEEPQQLEAEEVVAQEFEEAPVQEFAVDPEAAPLDETPIDNFGGPDIDTKPRTRVRMRRVRASSKEEAEAKVATDSRRVIKSIPVDIVERWGPNEGGKP